MRSYAARQKASRAPQGAPEQHALQAGDCVSRRDRLGAEVGAVHVRMTGLATVIVRHRFEPFGLAAVAHVVDQSPSAVERGRTQIIAIPGHNVAGGIADAATDAFDAGIGRLSFLRLRRNDGEILLRRGARLKEAMRRFPLVEELRHLHRKVFHHGEIAQRLEPQALITGDDLVDPRAAGPARPPIHHHGAGSAHADAAGKTIGKGRIVLALDFGHHVEDGLVLSARKSEGLELAILRAAPNVDREDVTHRCMPQRLTVRASMVQKITDSTSSPIRITVSRPAKTVGVSRSLRASKMYQPMPPERDETPNTSSAATSVRHAKAQPIFRPARMDGKAAGIKISPT